MLYLANHTFHALPTGCVTLGGLLAHVGAAPVVEGFAPANESPVLTPGRSAIHDLWDHSVQVAALSAHTALKAAHLGIAPPEAYLAGLLHDLGRFIILTEAPDQFAAVTEHAWRNGDELLAAETQICGFDHAVLGWLACRAWNFPESLAAVTRFHHVWKALDDEAMSRRTRALVSIVGACDDLAFAWDAHHGDEAALAEPLRRVANALASGARRPAQLGTVSEVGAILRRTAPLTALSA
jgi:HD-like signal output (HDOD) protein